MGEVFNKFIELASGKYAKRFWIILICVFVILLFLYPYIDANFLVYNRLEQRIEVLDKITKLDTVIINENTLLKQEYDSILNEIKNAQGKSIINIINTEDSKEDEMIKFILGGVLFWGVGFAYLFAKEDQQISTLRKLANKIIVVAFCVAIGILFAYVGRTIPTIINIWVNIIAYPVLEIIGVFLLFNDTNENK